MTSLLWTDHADGMSRFHKSFTHLLLLFVVDTGSLLRTAHCLWCTNNPYSCYFSIIVNQFTRLQDTGLDKRLRTKQFGPGRVRTLVDVLWTCVFSLRTFLLGRPTTLVKHYNQKSTSFTSTIDGRVGSDNGYWELDMRGFESCLG